MGAQGRGSGTELGAVMEEVPGVAVGQRLKGKRGDGSTEAVKSECGLRQEWDSDRWGTCSRQRVAIAVTGDVCTNGRHTWSPKPMGEQSAAFLLSRIPSSERLGHTHSGPLIFLALAGSLI